MECSKFPSGGGSMKGNCLGSPKPMHLICSAVLSICTRLISGIANSRNSPNASCSYNLKHTPGPVLPALPLR